MILTVKEASSLFLAQGTRTNIYTKIVMAGYDKLSQSFLLARMF